MDELQLRIEQIEKDIKVLKQKAHARSVQSKAEAELVVARLEKKLTDLKARMAGHGADATGAWKDVQEGLKRAASDIEQACRDAMERLS